MPPKVQSAKDDQIKKLEEEKRKLEDKVKLLNKDLKSKDDKIKKLEKLEDEVKLLRKNFDFSSLPSGVLNEYMQQLYEDTKKQLTQENENLQEKLDKAEAALKNKSNDSNEGQRSRSGTAKEDARTKEIERLQKQTEDQRDKLKEKDAENDRLIKNIEDKNEEIQRLREKLENLEKEKNDQVQKQDKKENERSVDAENTLRKELSEAKERATKIEKLEKELREANDMIEKLKILKESNAEKPNLPNDNTSTLQTKEKELNDKEAKLNKKEEELKTRESETINKEKELKKRENDANSQEEKMRSRENEINRQHIEMEATKSDVERRKEALQKVENELSRKREELKSEMENRKQQEAKEQHGSPANKLNTKEFTDLEAQLKSKEKVITQLNIELSDIKIKFDKEPPTNDKNSFGLNADMQKKEQEIVRLQNELTEAKGDLKKRESENESLNKDLRETQSELKKTETDRMKLNNDLGTAISTIEELRTKISKLEKEKTKIDSSNSRSKSANVYRQKLEAANNEIEELKTRLSKVMGANITDNNPDIADLSDLNRPTKLAEKYSELYDNEWTDAFEEIEKSGVKEVDVIKRLFDSFKDVYKFCNQVSVNYTKSIKASALLIPGTDNGRPNTPNLPPTSRKQITELRKTFAPSLAGDVFKQYLKATKQSLDKCPQTKRYIKACVDLCWLMSIQDPPVVLDLGDPKGLFDGDKYKSYTKTGKMLDYVVWPPLRLHDGGALLSKGVAQGK